LDAVLVGPGHPLYAAVDERLNEMLSGLAGSVAVFEDPSADHPYRLHFFDLAIRGQNTKGETHALYGELIAVRENIDEPASSPERFAVVPADLLLDLPNHPSPPSALDQPDPSEAADFLKGGYQTEVRARCLDERRRFVDVCRDYLTRSFNARIHAAQDRVMSLRAREQLAPEMAIARQRAENDLADLERTRVERLAGLDRLMIVKHGPLRHVATTLALPTGTAVSSAFNKAPEDLDPVLKRRCEKAAEDMVVAFETARGWDCERVGHLKIGFDVRSLGPADAQTGYRDPVEGIRRIEVKGRTRGQPVRLTTNEWYKAQQLGESYWLYVVWDPLGKPDPEPLRIRNPAKHLDHAKREVVAQRFFDVPAMAIEQVAAQFRNAGR
jgi:Domain of unknown function (DUF3883)